MERSLTITAPNSENENFFQAETDSNSTCKVCGEAYKKPLYAMVSSGDHESEYYACPRCLSKVRHVGARSKPDKVEEAANKLEKEENEGLTEQKIEIESEDKPEENLPCVHKFGYLKRRPKNTAIPDQCLTCTKMIECM